MEKIVMNYENAVEAANQIMAATPQWWKRCILFA